MDQLFSANLPAWLVLLLDIFIKSSILMVVALIFTGIQKRVSAAVKHYVLSVSFALLMVLPLFIYLAPGIDLVSYFKAEEPQKSETPLFLSDNDSESEEFIWPSQTADSPLAFTNEFQAEPAIASFSDQTLNALPSILFYLWLSGVTFILLRLLVGMFFIWRKSLQSGAIIESQWGNWVNEYKQKLGINRPVILLRSHSDDSPVTWGTFRPLILLPQNSMEWSEERIQAVLMHEMAHISRWDTLIQAMAQIACAIHWMNPLVWIAYREFIIEREHACDDMVLSVGIKPSEYASELVDIAKKSAKASTFSTLSAVHMARPSQLKERIKAVLEEGRARVVVSRKEVEMGLLGAILFLLPAAFYWPWVVQKSGAFSNSISSFFTDQNEPTQEIAFEPQPLKPNIPAYDEAMIAWEKMEMDRVDRLRNRERVEAERLERLTARENARVSREDISREWKERAERSRFAVNSEVLQTYLTAAKDPNSNVRYEAIKSLVRFKNIPEVTEILYDRAVNDESSNIRYLALNSLRSFRNEETFQVMMKAANDNSSNIRYLAVNYLRSYRFDSRAIEVVRSKMNDESSNVRYAALQILRGQRSDHVKDALLEATKDESSNIRFQALGELRAFISDEKVRTRVQEMTTDESSNIRFKALQMLAHTNESQGIDKSDEYDALIEAALKGNESTRLVAVQAAGRLEEPYFVEKMSALTTDPSLPIRMAWAEALARIEDPLAIPQLGILMQDDNANLRLTSINGLGRVEDPAAIPYLAKGLTSKNEGEQVAIIKALGRIEDVNALPFLAEYSQSADLSFATIIALAETVGRIEEPAGISVLEILMDEPMNASVKIAMLKALGRIEDASSVPLVIEIMKSDNNPQVIIEGLDALGRIEDESALATVSAFITSNNESIKSAAIKAYSKMN